MSNLTIHIILIIGGGLALNIGAFFYTRWLIKPYLDRLQKMSDMLNHTAKFAVPVPYLFFFLSLGILVTEMVMFEDPKPEAKEDADGGSERPPER